MTPQQRLDYLLADVWQPTNAAITIATIRDEIGFTPEQYGLVRGTLETAIATLKADSDAVKRMQGIDLQDALSAMLSRGISLSSQNRQDTIDLLAAFGQWPDAVTTAVKALGGVYRKQWQVEGMAVQPTLESITKQAIIDTARTAINSKATAVNAWLDAADLSAYTEAGLQAYCDGLLASSDGNGGGE